MDINDIEYGYRETERRSMNEYTHTDQPIQPSNSSINNGDTIVTWAKYIDFGSFDLASLFGISNLNAIVEHDYDSLLNALGIIFNHILSKIDNGDIISIAGITITGNNGSTLPNEITVNDNITLKANLTPSGTTQTGVSWSIVSGNDKATITQNGLTAQLTATSAGSITVQCKSSSNSNIFDRKTFTINAAIVPIIGITISSNDGSTLPNDLTVGDYITLKAILDPATTSQTGVSWSIVNGNDKATISTRMEPLTAQLRAISAGSITVQCKSRSNSNIFDRKTFTINAAGEDEPEITVIQWKCNTHSLSVGDYTSVYLYYIKDQIEEKIPRRDYTITHTNDLNISDGGDAYEYIITAVTAGLPGTGIEATYNSGTSSLTASLSFNITGGDETDGLFYVGINGFFDQRDPNQNLVDYSDYDINEVKYDTDTYLSYTVPKGTSSYVFAYILPTYGVQFYMKDPNNSSNEYRKIDTMSLTVQDLKKIDTNNTIKDTNENYTWCFTASEIAGGTEGTTIYYKITEK